LSSHERTIGVRRGLRDDVNAVVQHERILHHESVAHTERLRHDDIAPRRKKMLLEGLDEIDLMLTLEPKIATFQAADRAGRPWIYPA